MLSEEVVLDLAQLIQDYFLWAFDNPEEAAHLSTLPSPQQTGKVKTTHSDLLGFSRWLARGKK
jgi:hypothetical protein